MFRFAQRLCFALLNVYVSLSLDVYVSLSLDVYVSLSLDV